MTENRDIYKTTEPASPSKPPETGIIIEPTGAQVRAKTWRNSIAFTVLMLGLLGGSTWMIYQQEQKAARHAEEQEAGNPLDTTSLLARQQPVTGTPSRVAGGQSSFSITRDQPAVRGGAPVDPEKMAQAMAETRTANDYLLARDWDRADAHVRKALEIAPDMNAAMRLLGVIYTQRGQFDQAIAILEKAMRLDPYNAETYNNLSTAYMQKGMMDKAEELLQASLQIDPSYQVAFLNLGLLYLARGRYAEAADYLERALAQVPNDPGPRNNLAVALIRLGRYPEAREQLETIIRMNPQIANSYFNLAISYVLERNFDEAMKWIRMGTEYCSPVICQRFLADSDFNAIREYPAFQELAAKLYPEVGQPVQNP